jgi:hypothetical protein
VASPWRQADHPRSPRPLARPRPFAIFGLNFSLAYPSLIFCPNRHDPIPKHYLDRLDLLGRYRGQSTADVTRDVLDAGLRVTFETLSANVAAAIKTLAPDSAPQEAGASNATDRVVEYDAARLRFLKKRIEPMRPNDLLRIKVTGEGIFEMTKQQALDDFKNVIKSRSYLEAGYYHYSTTPQRALKYRVSAY